MGEKEKAKTVKLTFCGENFHRLLQMVSAHKIRVVGSETTKFAKGFSLKSFPLYVDIHSVVGELLEN